MSVAAHGAAAVHEAHHFRNLTSISQFYHTYFRNGNTVNLPMVNTKGSIFLIKILGINLRVGIRQCVKTTISQRNLSYS